MATMLVMWWLLSLLGQLQRPRPEHLSAWTAPGTPVLPLCGRSACSAACAKLSLSPQGSQLPSVCPSPPTRRSGYPGNGKVTVEQLQNLQTVEA